jgi:predicted RNA binding protein YcfA (HicA-like mRNA interferase family)
MNDYGKRVKELLTENGWKSYRHGKGSHDMWTNHDNSLMVSVPHGIKSRHTANDILKRAKLKERIR